MTPTPTSGIMYLASSCCSDPDKYVILPSDGLAGRIILIGGQCYELIEEKIGSPAYVGTLLGTDIIDCLACTAIYTCTS
jgi:hypothetical protein